MVPPSRVPGFALPARWAQTPASDQHLLNTPPEQTLLVCDRECLPDLLQQVDQIEFPAYEICEFVVLQSGWHGFPLVVLIHLKPTGARVVDLRRLFRRFSGMHDGVYLDTGGTFTLPALAAICLHAGQSV
jgi:hypothetical protein